MRSCKLVEEQAVHYLKLRQNDISSPWDSVLLTLPKVQGQGERAIHTNGRSHKRIDVKIVIDRGGHNERICQEQQ